MNLLILLLFSFNAQLINTTFTLSQSLTSIPNLKSFTISTYAEVLIVANLSSLVYLNNGKQFIIKQTIPNTA